MVSTVITIFEIRFEEDSVPGGVAVHRCSADIINWQSKKELADKLNELMEEKMKRAEEENETIEEPFLRSFNIQHFPDDFEGLS